MGVILNMAIVLLLLWVLFYTVSYGVWSWKRKNRLGGVAVFLLAVITVAITIYTSFFRFG